MVDVVPSFIESARGRPSCLIPCQIPFFNNICGAAECDGWVSFGHDIPSTKLKSLYIRESYRTISSSIKSGVNKATITGTPGIGKSLFLVYLFWMLVKKGKRVLFIHHPLNIYYNGQGSVFQISNDNFPSDIDYSFWNDTLWCLFDAKHKTEVDLAKIPYEFCTIVLSTSPRRDMVNDFKKPPVPQYFYMPVWTETELEKIAPTFSNATEWRDRFKILGGIPRYVLEDMTLNPKTIIEDACSSCSLDECIKKIGINSSINDKSKVIHSLIHMTSTTPFTESSVCYASQAVLNTIIEKKRTEAKRRMEELLASCEGNPLTASLCGYIFEPYVLELLEQGGTFSCRQLVRGNTKKQPSDTTLVIPPSTKVVVDKVLPNQTLNQLHVPRTKNYTAIDTWIPGIGAFQITVSKKHDINNGAIKDLALLGNGANKFYWLLPPLYYHSFTKKSPQEIDQYAVLIHYPQ